MDVWPPTQPRLVRASVPAARERRCCSLRRRAKRDLGRGSVARAHTGAVAAIQRTDSALRLNVHFHLLAVDGAHLREDEDDPLAFFPLSTPTRAQIAGGSAHVPSANRRGREGVPPPSACHFLINGKCPCCN